MANECEDTMKVSWGPVTAAAVPGAWSVVAVSWPYHVTCDLDSCPGRGSTDPRFCVTPVPDGVITKYLFQVWDMGPSLGSDMRVCLSRYGHDLSFCMELLGVDYEDIFDMGTIIMNTPGENDVRFDSKCRCVGALWDRTSRVGSDFQNSKKDKAQLAEAVKRHLSRDIN
tara:strand:+ start:638 stop:1144 length:507 start_codon:yes stop_codon:yes gene_type:complete